MSPYVSHGMAFTLVSPCLTESVWDIDYVLLQCVDIIEHSLTVAQALMEDVDLHLMMHDPYGKGFIKKCAISPDAFIQMALQLAYYRVRHGGDYKLRLHTHENVNLLFRPHYLEISQICLIGEQYNMVFI